MQQYRWRSDAGEFLKQEQIANLSFYLNHQLQDFIDIYKWIDPDRVFIAVQLSERG